MKKRDKKLVNCAIPVLVVGCLIIIWWIAAAIVGDEIALPSPIKTIEEIFSLLKKGSFYLAFSLTVLRSVAAFAASFVIAFLLAFASTKNEYACRAIKPIIGVLRSLPTVAVVLILLLWTSNQVAPAMVTSLVVLPTLYTGIENSIKSVDRQAVEACEFFGVSKKNILKKVVLPQIAPQILLCVGSGISLNLKLMVAAEVLSQTPQSIGFWLNTSKVYYETWQTIAIVVLCVIVGVIVESVFSKLSRRFGKWE